MPVTEVVRAEAPDEQVSHMAVAQPDDASDRDTIRDLVATPHTVAWRS